MTEVGIEPRPHFPNYSKLSHRREMHIIFTEMSNECMFSLELHQPSPIIAQESRVPKAQPTK